MDAETQQAPLLSNEDEKVFMGERSPSDKEAASAEKKSEEVIGVPASAEWRTGLFSCCFPEEEGFTGQDCEICMLGLFAPCVLYASTRERLTGNPADFSGACGMYFSVCALSRFFLHSGILEGIYSYPTRSYIRNRFGLKGHADHCTALAPCCLSHCAGTEPCERSCDLCLHLFCHPCALCQEAREVRRALPAASGPVVLAVVQAPAAQTMAA